MIWLRRSFLPLWLLAGLAVLTIGATANDLALQIAGVIVLGAPLLMPFVLKYVPAAGGWMVAISYGVSLVVAIVAGLVSGAVKLTDLSTAPGALAASMAVYGLSQLVYNIFKAHKTFGAKLVI
jgi:hypothetical protein